MPLHTTEIIAVKGSKRVCQICSRNKTQIREKIEENKRKREEE